MVSFLINIKHSAIEPKFAFSNQIYFYHRNKSLICSSSYLASLSSFEFNSKSIVKEFDDLLDYCRTVYFWFNPVARVAWIVASLCGQNSLAPLSRCCRFCTARVCAERRTERAAADDVPAAGALLHCRHSPRTGFLSFLCRHIISCTLFILFPLWLFIGLSIILMNIPSL